LYKREPSPSNAAWYSSSCFLLRVFRYTSIGAVPTTACTATVSSYRTHKAVQRVLVGESIKVGEGRESAVRMVGGRGV
jgi:hypothetical protein